MKKLILVPILALFTSACATSYPTTELDRELALKLADRPQVIMAPSAPAQPVIVNVNNNPTAQPTMTQDTAYTKVCNTMPIRDINGRIVSESTSCW